MKTNDFLHALDEPRITSAIAEAEKRTSGEIRVYVTEKEISDPIVSAREHFSKLGMTQTAQRNGVLIFIAPRTQSYAIIGDEGIHQKCGQGFWEHITHDMDPMLKQGKFSDAIVYAVQEIGEALAKNFPFQANDKNELPNAIIRDHNRPSE